MRILLLSNSVRGEYNFRRERILGFLAAGHEVVLSCPPAPRVQYFVDAGCGFRPSPISQYGKNPFRELQVLAHYLRLIRDEAPDLVVTATVKPNVWGGIASRVLGVPYIANVNGLGRALEAGGAIQQLSTKLYRVALRRAESVNFQNESNRNFFLSLGIGAHQAQLFPGSGVNLDHFTLAPYPPEDQETRFLFLSRVQKAKGFKEYVEAATQLREQRGDVVFEVLGPMTEDYAEMVAGLEAQGILQYLGETDDVRPHLERAHALVLPSYHEGLSNVLLEAAAMGRPVLASDIPGCRETFDEGKTGFGFESRDSVSLVEALNKFLDLSRTERETMGLLGRAKVGREFDRERVVQMHLHQIDTIRRKLERDSFDRKARN